MIRPIIGGMSRNTVPLVALLLSHLALAAALALTYHQLPQRVASHFDAAGAPDDWMSRPWHVGLMQGAALGLSALLMGIFSTIRFFPAWCINLPHKEYWLAPERRGATMDFLLRMGAWLATFETLWLLAIHLLVVAANRTQPVRLTSGIWGLLLGFLAVIGGWMFTLFWRFQRVTPGP